MRAIVMANLQRTNPQDVYITVIHHCMRAIVMANLQRTNPQDGYITACALLAWPKGRKRI
jgi:hypothetical protein